MSQKARVRQTRKNIVSRQPWIIPQNARFGLSGGEQFQDKFDGQSSASYYGFTGENSGIDHNAIGPGHGLMIPRPLRRAEHGLAGRQGFEPPYAAPEAAVLPLDHLPTGV